MGFLNFAILLCAAISAVADGDSRIRASPKFDPGVRDVFQSFKDELAQHGDKDMDNLQVISNDGNAPGANGVPLVQAADPKYPASDTLVSIEAYWTLAQRKRNFVLIVEDMENGYKQWVNYVIPQVKQLLSTFRKLKLPVVWTNWVRRADDGLYNAVDRFYGPQGVKAEVNPAYIYGENGTETVSELYPQNEEEMSRLIESLHLNKFADFDEEGREILYPMLKAWGVNTLIMTGAWTDDCIAATVFDAVDRYGFDVVLVKDGMATATIHGHKIMDVMCAAVGKCHKADEIVQFLEKNPQLVEKPKDELNGRVYKKNAKKSSHAEL